MAPQQQMVTLNDFHQLIPKFRSEDPDIRYMSLVDLGRFLENSFPTILNNQLHLTSTLVASLVDLLDDANGDVQNQALKCIKPFAERVLPPSLLQLMERIVNLETSKSQDTSITSAAARTLLLALPHAVPGTAVQSEAAVNAFEVVSKALLPKLVPNSRGGKFFINFDNPNGVSIESLDLLTQVVQCYGTMLLPKQLIAIQECIMRILNDSNTRPIAKKRAISCIAKLSSWFTTEQLDHFMRETAKSFESPNITISERRTLIAILGAMVRSSPSTIAPYIPAVISFVFDAVGKREYDQSLEAISEDRYNPETDELKETTLSTLEEFLICCTNDMRPYTSGVVDSGLRHLSYDPTMIANDDDEMIDEDEPDLDGDDDDDSDYEQEEQYDDEDDSSWKIRRSSGKLLYALVSTRPDLIESMYLHDEVLPALVKAFKDREDSVQLEALRAVTLIIHRTVDIAPPSLSSLAPTNGTTIANDHISTTRKRRRAASNADELSAEETSRGYASPKGSLQFPTSGPRSALLKQASVIVPGAIGLLTEKSTSSRQSAIVLLRAFVQLKHDSLNEFLDNVLQPVIETVAATNPVAIVSRNLSTGSITELNSNPRIEALKLLSVIFDTHSSTSTAPYIRSAIEAVTSASEDRNLKTAGQALTTAESIIKVLTPPRAFGYDEKSTQYLEEVFDLVMSRAGSNNAEIEVRNHAIQALGVCLARSGSLPGSALNSRRAQGFKFLLERLAGENTRISATLAIDSIMTSNQAGEFDPALINQVASELSNHLRKVDRRVRSVGLGAIKKLTSNKSAKKHLNQATIKSLSLLLLQQYKSDGVQNSALVSEILTDLVILAPGAVVTTDFNDAVCEVVRQSFGGHALHSFLELIAAVGNAKASGALMAALLQKVGVSGDPYATGSTIGTLVASEGSSSGASVESFVQEINSKADDKRVTLALIVLGEIASILGPESKLSPDIFIESLKSNSDVVQATAASALGRASAANTDVFLPMVIQTIQTKATKPYNGLLSVRELLLQVGRSNSGLKSYGQHLWDNLMESAKDETLRSLAAECIGRLAAIEPKKFLPLLQDHLKNTQPGIRGTMIQAVRFTISDAGSEADETLWPSLHGMLTTMLQDKDIENKRMAMATLQSAARHKLGLIYSNLPLLLDQVTAAAHIDPSLVREVQMGPFKHKVDDGLELRKAAYETLLAFMDVGYSRMNHTQVLDRIVVGLQDDYDIKVLCFLMISKLLKVGVDELREALPSLAERFQAILDTKLKENAVKQEVERLRQVTQEVFSATAQLRAVYGDDSGQKWQAYIANLQRTHAADMKTAEEQLKIIS